MEWVPMEKKDERQHQILQKMMSEFPPILSRDGKENESGKSISLSCVWDGNDRCRRDKNPLVGVEWDEVNEIYQLVEI